MFVDEPDAVKDTSLTYLSQPSETTNVIDWTNSHRFPPYALETTASALRSMVLSVWKQTVSLQGNHNGLFAREAVKALRGILFVGVW